MKWFRRDLRPPVSEPEPEPGSEPEDDPAALLAAVDELDRYITGNAGRLPTVAVIKARWVVDTLRETVATTETRPLDVHALVSIRSTTRDYLPTTLRAYLALAGHVVADGDADTAAAGLLIEQLDTLQQSASLALSAVRTQDVDALVTQGAFLRTKFSRSDLDL